VIYADFCPLNEVNVRLSYKIISELTFKASTLTLRRSSGFMGEELMFKDISISLSSAIVIL
jgi:hypothetical protein